MSEQLPTLALPHLKSLELWGRTGVVRSVMDHVVLPESANINLSSDTPNHALSEMLPTTNRILGIPSINRLIVDIGHASNESLSYRYSAWGEANAEDEERLSLHSFMVLPPSSVNEFDLCRFFEGFVSIFPPSSITYLKLSCFDTPVDKNGGFAYIFNYYPHLTHLNLDLTSLEGALAALAQDGILVHLQRFEVEIDVIGGQYSSVEYETVVSVLETRASRGLRLQSFSLSVEVADEQDYLPLPMADHLIRRLASIISDLSIQPPHYPACSRS
ncbi:hypothetical protein C8T65DRAFT_40302 [Cerioporus squamosus]|nr:hypothetical protein C8T65DRAFT_40302 [Cerioporus squamosus]